MLRLDGRDWRCVWAFPASKTLPEVVAVWRANSVGAFRLAPGLPRDLAQKLALAARMWMRRSVIGCGASMREESEKPADQHLATSFNRYR